jgi:hypothetical protein
MAMSDNGPPGPGEFNRVGDIVLKEPEKTLEEQALIVPKEPKSFSYLNCPNCPSPSRSCLLTEQPYNSSQGSGVNYELCNFSGEDYRTCPRMVASTRVLEALFVVSAIKVTLLF